jgi:hypothetical protein
MSAKNMPTPDALSFAAEWLRHYDDTHDGGQQTAIAAEVADWLDEQAAAKTLRDAARGSGVPVKALRARLARADDASRSAT